MHPKVKLFISHGGISGMYEALDAGIPVLGFPLFYDQPRNLDNLVNAEMAISMDLFTVSNNTLLSTILELINDKKLVQIFSKIMRYLLVIYLGMLRMQKLLLFDSKIG